MATRDHGASRDADAAASGDALSWRPRFVLGLRARLILIVLLASLPAFAVLHNQGLRRVADAEQAARERNRAVALGVANEHRLRVEGVAQLLRRLATLPAVRQASGPELDAMLAQVMGTAPLLANLGVIGQDGILLASALPTDRRTDLSDRGYFSEAQTRAGIAVGDLQVGRVTGRSSINLGLALDGAPPSVLFAAVDLHVLSRTPLLTSLAEEGVVYIFDRTGRPIARHPDGAEALGVATASAPAAARLLESVRRDYICAEAPLLVDGKRVGFVLACLPRHAAVARAEAELRTHHAWMGVVALAALAATLVLGSLFVRRRVARLLRVTAQVAAGDWSARVGAPYGSGELGVLDRAFDEMAAQIESTAGSLRAARDDAERRREVYRGLVDEVPAVFYVADVDASFDRVHCAFVNGYADRVLSRGAHGWWPGDPVWEEALHEEDRERVTAQIRELLRGTGPYRIEYRMHAADGSVRWFRDRGVRFASVDGRPASVRGFAVDATETKELEEQYHHAQKMEAVGRLASGVAHDFNNLLTVISGYTSLVETGGAVAPADAKRLTEVRRAADRAATLTRQLLLFSRKEAVRPIVLPVNDAVGELSRFLSRLLGARVRLRTELDPDAGSVAIDPGQFDQILTNLVVNARDAMPEGGEVTIHTAAPGAVGDGTGGEFVRISVTDTGTGMSPEVRQRIFEPFFTTKQAGEGTGLGLATVYAIATQASGRLEVESEPGRGSAFHVFLPAARQPAAAAAETLDAGVPPQGSGTLLVVEDEEEVRAFIVATLEQAGYEVLEAESGAAALAALAAHRGPIRAVVTDCGLPDMDGKQLVRAFWERRPESRVLYISGSPEGVDLDMVDLEQGARFLLKPFGASALLWRVWGLVGGDAGEPVPSTDGSA